MEKQIVKLEAPELKTIEQSKAQKIKETFEPMVKMLEEFEESYNQVITEGQKGITEELTAKAKRLRIDIGKVRIQTGKLKDEGKAEYLRAERAIQAVHNIIVWAVTDKEDKLKEIEKHFEIQEQKRLEKLQADRAEKLSKYVEDAHERDLASMEDDVWKAYFSTKKQEYDDRVAAEKKAEQERIENERLDKLEHNRQIEIAPYYQFIDEVPDLRTISDDDYAGFLAKAKKAKADYDTEQERIRKENERIRKQQEEERKKAEAEIKKERQERERIENEIRAKKEAEEAEKKRIAEEQRKADLAPDKEKLLAFAGKLEKIELPKLFSQEAEDILAKAISAIAHTAKTLRNITNEKL